MYSKEDIFFIVPEIPMAQKAIGGFAQKTMVVVQVETAMNDWKSFLTKLLGAAKLSLDNDVLLYQINENEQYQLAPELKQKEPLQVLIFGAAPPQLGLHIQAIKYQPIIFSSTTLVFADRLSVLEPDKNLKAKMWTALKEIFKIQ